MVNVAPWPAGETAVTRPPCSSAICCTIDRPRPEPPLWRLRDYDNQVQAMDDYCDRMARAEGWTDEMQDQLDGETD